CWNSRGKAALSERPWSSNHPPQIPVADRNRLERRTLHRILLHKEVLNADLLRRRDHSLPVDRPRANFGKVFRRRPQLLRGRESRFAILNMDHPRAAGVALQHLHRIASRLRQPVAIELQPDEFGISVLHDLLKAGGTAKSGVPGSPAFGLLEWEALELIVVIVEGEPHPQLLRHLTPGVELLRRALEAV